MLDMKLSKTEFTMTAHSHSSEISKVTKSQEQRSCQCSKCKRKHRVLSVSNSCFTFFWRTLKIERQKDRKTEKIVHGKTYEKIKVDILGK